MRDQVRQCVRHVPVEMDLAAPDSLASDPRAALDLVVTGPNDAVMHMPGFRRGDGRWAVRFAAPQLGRHTWRTVWSSEAGRDLEGQHGELEAVAYDGQNPLYQHGSVHVAEDRRHFVHVDGTPFFWLGDTWWNGLAKRFRWPEDFLELTRDRKEKGFTVVQITAGMPPVMDSFDERAANEAGWPWTEGFASINAGFFDLADQRIRHLVEQGIVPCIVGSWGYQALRMPLDKLKRHWRELIARWSAYPVVWCGAGEATMPWYVAEDKAADAAEQKRVWADVLRYIREADPYYHPVSLHACWRGIGDVSSSRCETDDPSLIDYDMQQNSHLMQECIPSSVASVAWSIRQKPTMPVLNDEVGYEGVFDANPPVIQRALFWLSILSGAVAGYTYGATGIWEFTTPDCPDAGLEKTQGRQWSLHTWQTAYRWPGSGQVGLSKRFLATLPWWKIEPHQEWVRPSWQGGEGLAPFAGGVPRQFRLIYTPAYYQMPVVRHLEPDVAYEATSFNPITGETRALGTVDADARGQWRIPTPAVVHDWVIYLTSQELDR